MRTNINTAVTNCSVFGLSQDVVVTVGGDSCAYAAQHLESRHASKRARGWGLELKRSWPMTVAMAGAALITEALCLVITGPRRLRLLSPVVLS